ncbi:MAG: hypothetical protein AAFV43_03900 [Planctomycetota bacterium]
MGSLVLELQQRCADSGHDVLDLLRFAKLAAVKLDLKDIATWIDHELDGYPPGIDVPSYRQVQAEMKVFNPYHGLQPFYMPERMERKLCEIPYQGSISTAIACINGKGPPTIPLTPKQRNFLLENMEIPLEPIRTINKGYLSKMVEAVRTRLLEWSLNLEREGILGEGMSFTSEERARAATPTTYNINSFQGVLGDVSGSSVTQTLTAHVSVGDLESLKTQLRKVGVTSDDISHLEKAISSDGPLQEGGGYGESVKAWIGGMIGKAASSAWQVGASAAGGILAAAPNAYYGIGG